MERKGGWDWKGKSRRSEICMSNEKLAWISIALIRTGGQGLPPNVQCTVYSGRRHWAPTVDRPRAIMLPQPTRGSVRPKMAYNLT